MWKTGAILRKAKGKAALRLEGCPVSVAEQLMVLVHLSGARTRRRTGWRLGNYLKWKSVMAGKALFGHKYQIHGAAPRGEAMPEGMQPSAQAEHCLRAFRDAGTAAPPPGRGSNRQDAKSANGAPRFL